MSCRIFVHVFYAVLILHLLAVPGAAQVDRASLTGTVTDASGAVVVKAKVSVHHQGSGLAREGETDETVVVFYPSGGLSASSMCELFDLTRALGSLTCAKRVSSLLELAPESVRSSREELVEWLGRAGTLAQLYLARRWSRP